MGIKRGFRKQWSHSDCSRAHWLGPLLEMGVVELFHLTLEAIDLSRCRSWNQLGPLVMSCLLLGPQPAFTQALGPYFPRRCSLQHQISGSLSDFTNSAWAFQSRPKCSAHFPQTLFIPREDHFGKQAATFGEETWTLRSHRSGRFLALFRTNNPEKWLH